MIKTVQLLFVLGVLTVLNSCSGNFDAEKGKAVARVGKYYLYESDIEKLIKNDVSDIDSTIIVEAYINRWARKKVVLEKAQLNLSDEETNFNRLLEEYHEGLITNAYRSKLVAQYLDTIIKPSEIKEFYDLNKSTFLLNQDLVMLKYADFPSGVTNMKHIVKLFKSDDRDDISELEELCYQYSNRFGISDSTWVPLHELKSGMPELRKVRTKELLKKDNFIEIQDSLNLYLTRILNVRMKREIAPVSYVERRIKNIILNKRKLSLIREMEEQILKDAIKNEEFETFK
ncbi:MAG: hypothetical protein ABFR62_05340 [Bacteroidota bacterium]